MENLFDIEKNRMKEYPVLVYSLGYHQISDFIKPLENKLKEQRYNGIVLFDLLRSNGLNNRYFTFIFTGEKFDYNSGKQIQNLPKGIIKKTNSFQTENKSGLENSILTKSEKIRLVRQESVY